MLTRTSLNDSCDSVDKGCLAQLPAHTEEAVGNHRYMCLTTRALTELLAGILQLCPLKCDLDGITPR